MAPVPKVHQKGLILAVLQGKHQNPDEITCNTFDILRKVFKFTGCRSHFGAIAARKDLEHGSSQSFACSDVNPNYVRAPQTVMRYFVPGSVLFQTDLASGRKPGSLLVRFGGHFWQVPFVPRGLTRFMLYWESMIKSCKSELNKVDFMLHWM